MRALIRIICIISAVFGLDPLFADGVGDATRNVMRVISVTEDENGTVGVGTGSAFAVSRTVTTCSSA